MGQHRNHDPKFALGQRWISETESELGLGLIQHIEGRFVEIFFPAAELVRRYAQDNAPVIRVRFQPGDEIQIQDQQFSLIDVRQEEGLIFYSDGTNWYPETQLNAHLNLSRALDRLFAGQIDKSKAFTLRMAALEHQSQQAEQESFGLMGARTQLLMHQLYIAKEVSDRETPRVLLADEVGLGKTIEAGLIIHRLLISERIQRVLILVPTNLIHQWWIEMARRFNLRFSIIDEESWIAQPDENPFTGAQLVLASVGSVAADLKRSSDCIQAGWDLVAVDEAHHLAWEPSHIGADPKYELVAQLAALTPALLLLTATPEQLGVAGHFARLRLLDPERFYDYQQFIQESQHYQSVAEAANALINNAQLDDTQIQHLNSWIETPVSGHPSDTQRQSWIQQLIDRHGTGRVVFRNTRNGIRGFPQRSLVTHELEAVEFLARTQNLFAAADESLEQTLVSRLYPERLLADWADWDPRIPWLQQLLSTHAGEKFLLICHQQQTVQALYEKLRVTYGIHCAQFHEQMTLIDRDRSAAYFSDPEEGTQLMLCSEIGSEGRNFQFVQHLILFDLPLNCDLLEQRIGRLDRIGQQTQFFIHVPIFTGGANAALLRIYQQGLGLFDGPSVAAQELFEQYQIQVTEHLCSDSEDIPGALDQLVAQIKAEKQALDKVLAAGRDQLLELNSCDKKRAVPLLDSIRADDCHCAQTLPGYLEQLCDLYGIDQEEMGHQCLAMRPGDQMIADNLPYLPQEGLTYTCQREVAVSRDDVQFFTWEHPFVRSTFDVLLSSSMGNNCVGFIRDHEFTSGTFYLDLLFLLGCQVPKGLQIHRYVPANGMRLCCDPEGQVLKHAPVLRETVQDVPSAGAIGLIRKTKPVIQAGVQQLTHEAELLLPQLIQKAQFKMQHELNGEIDRLTELARRNPNIPAVEIQQLRQKQALLRDALNMAQLSLDSVRVIFCA